MANYERTTSLMLVKRYFDKVYENYDECFESCFNLNKEEAYNKIEGLTTEDLKKLKSIIDPLYTSFYVELDYAFDWEDILEALDNIGYDSDDIGDMDDLENYLEENNLDVCDITGQLAYDTFNNIKTEIKL